MDKKLPGKRGNLAKKIAVKSAELTKICLKKKINLLDTEVYRRSRELDELVVEYMKSSHRK